MWWQGLQKSPGKWKFALICLGTLESGVGMIVGEVDDQGDLLSFYFISHNDFHVSKKIWCPWTCWCGHENVVFCTTCFHDGYSFKFKHWPSFSNSMHLFHSLEYQDVKLKKSNHATFKINNCEDGHILIDMLAPLLHMEVEVVLLCRDD